MDLNRNLILQIILVEIVLLCIIWLINDYTGSLISLVLGLLLLAVWTLSIIVELIEKSKVPRWYYQLMLFSGLACIGVFIIFTLIKGGQYNWMDSLF